jgi:DNA-directed RNA polymerase specialized sigma24 family protein
MPKRSYTYAIVGFGAAVTKVSKQAFLTAVEKTHGRELRRFLAGRLRNAAADTPDLMQEVYLRLLRVPNHETHGRRARES